MSIQSLLQCEGLQYVSRNHLESDYNDGDHNHDYNDDNNYKMHQLKYVYSIIIIYEGWICEIHTKKS